MARLYANTNGVLLRLLQTDAELARYPDAPGGTAFTLDFDPVANASVLTALNTDWNSHTCPAGTLKRNGVAVVFSGGTDGSWLNLDERADARALLASVPDAYGKLFRATAAVMVDELNALREWITSFKAAVAAATNLANLQARVAALGNLPDRTLAQAKTALAGRIDDGTAD